MGEGNEYLVFIMGQEFFMLFPIVIVFALYSQSSFRTTVNKKKMDFISTYILTIPRSLHFFV